MNTDPYFSTFAPSMNCDKESSSSDFTWAGVNQVRETNSLMELQQKCFPNIVSNVYLTVYYVRVSRSKRRRIREKVAKRFHGIRPDNNVYIMGNTIVMHPQVYAKFQKLMVNREYCGDMQPDVSVVLASTFMNHFKNNSKKVL